jgi:hypothetical protein
VVSSIYLGRKPSKYTGALHDDYSGRLANMLRLANNIEGSLTLLLSLCFRLLEFPGTLLWLGLLKVIVL